MIFIAGEMDRVKENIDLKPGYIGSIIFIASRDG